MWPARRRADGGISTNGQRLANWLRLVTDGWLLRRALATCFVVGLLVTAVNHGQDIMLGRLPTAAAWQIVLTFVVPFIVATVSPLGAVRERRSFAAFTDRDPRPVLRVGDDGILRYANGAASDLLASLGLRVGERVGEPIRQAVSVAAAGAGWLELTAGDRTHELLAVPVPEFGAVNLYGARP
jgi:hypothetical protein